jgi:hypothetical protein
MAGCNFLSRGIPNSRLQRQSAILNVFSEASENLAAWVFLIFQKLNVKGSSICSKAHFVQKVQITFQ